MKKSSIFQGLLLTLLAVPFSSFGDEAPKIAFEANKNQWPAQVKFKADIPGGSIFLEQNTFTYLYHENINWHGEHRNESHGPVKEKFHSYKVNFENSNPNSEIFGNNRYSWHTNYYIGDDQSKWASNVPSFEQVYYKGLYENIDMKVYNVESNLKYDIIVQAGGNPKNIRLNYNGTDGLKLENGHLFIHTSIYDLIEQKPYAYQVINGVKTQVDCEYVLKNNTVSFNLGNFDSTIPLIIDPTLIACTYSGSLADNWGFTATYDAAANIYIAGICAKAGYPATVGAWDQTFNGGMAVNFSPGTWPFDISISKFNPTGTGLLYATYYGGSLNEQPHSIIVNGNNELYVVGRTNSANFPTTAGAYDQTQNGGYDIIVGRFNSVGNLLGSTFVGGTGDDCVSINIDWSIYTSLKYNYTDDGRSEIVLDNNSNVYIAANTRSTNFPTTVNAYKAGAAIGGTQDAVVIKLNNTLSTLMYSTLLGGTGDDAAYGIKLDNSNNIYVTGGTTSNNFPTTAGVLHTTYQGGVADAFVSVFDPTLANAAQLLRSTYLGTAAFDQSYLIEIDASGDVYVYGQTKGAYPVSAGVYSNANSGQFIHKINGLLTTTIFSTVIGKGGLTPNISPTAFLVDSCQTIYIAGWGRGCTLDNTLDCSNSACVGLPLTANAMQSTTDGVDFYFAVLAPDAKALWYATFFGENTPGTPQDHVDGGTSRFDKRGVIYEACCASCGGTQAFPTKPGSYSTTNQGAVPPNGYGITGNNCNEAAVKMDVAVKPLAVAALTGPANGCAPFTVNFNNSGSSATDFIWDFGDGGVSFIASPSHVYTVPGTYTITLYAIDSIGICGFVDTALVAIKVGAHPVLSATGTNISCPPGLGSATVAVTPTGAMPPLTYAWTPSGGNTTIASGLGAGCYTVTVSDALGCSSTKSVCITQAPPLALATAATGALCGLANGSATVTVTGGVPNYTYSWQPSGKTTSAATGLLTGNYTITVTDSKGCTSQKVVTVPVSGGPTVTVTQLAPILCAGGNTGTASASIAGGTPPYTYAWTPIGGSGPVATGLTAGTYNVLVTDKNGCSGPGTITIGEPPALSATITATNVTCFNLNNGTATAIVSGGTPGYTYNWGTIPIQISQTASGLGTGTYTLLITDSNGCTSIQSTPSVTQPVALVVTATTSGSSCGTSANGGASATVTNGTAPYSYVWMPGGQTSPSITNIAGGTYTVVVTDANGCTQSTTATLVTSIKPFAEFTSKPIISCDGVSIQFKDSSQNALTWSWNFAGLGTSSSQNPSFPFPYNGNYNVTLIVTNPPCSDTVSHMISIGDLGSSTLVKEANVFSPNNDGENDCFHPALINPATGLPDEVLLPCTYLEVFDRWGVKMFESLGANGTNCWDGNNRNDSKPAIDGTYFYISTLGKTKIKGYVTLVRHK